MGWLPLGFPPPAPTKYPDTKAPSHPAPKRLPISRTGSQAPSYLPCYWYGRPWEQVCRPLSQVLPVIPLHQAAGSLAQIPALYHSRSPTSTCRPPPPPLPQSLAKSLSNPEQWNSGCVAHPQLQNSLMVLRIKSSELTSLSKLISFSATKVFSELTLP